MSDVQDPEWIWTADQQPPDLIPVLGLLLYRFENAPWRWSEPYIYRPLGEYSVPDLWKFVIAPPVPSRDLPAEICQPVETENQHER